MSIRKAARICQVNRTTLYSHLRGRYKDAPKDKKRQPFHFTDQEEACIVEQLREQVASGRIIFRADLSRAFLVFMNFRIYSTIIKLDNYFI